MLLMNILRTFIRRKYILKANGCVQSSKIPQTIGYSVYKMLQTFQDCVFQQTGQKYSSSSVDCDNKVINGKQYKKNINTFKNDYKNQFKGSNLCETYEEAVTALNNLQSNAESLRSSVHKRSNSLQDTKRYLLRSGLNIEDLEKLSYIHVSGTKGKGSTCALTESILRAYGVRTGFFSSPHLVSLTERLRINGQPISKEKFTQYFWPVYNKLFYSQEYENDMPAYFKFLTILAFHVYFGEKVDVLIMEVGIGGELDCTNIVPNTKTVGITSLGLEHTQLLGNTLTEIAWQKAGIIKPHASVYTSVTQEECLDIIKQRAKEKQAMVYKVPEFAAYFEDPKIVHLKGEINQCALLNGSLALQLAYDWLRQNLNGFHKNYDVNKPRLTEQAIKGITECNWPGRCQKIRFFNFNLHLDGAHTVESMQVCGNWFAQATSKSLLPKLLIFNTTGDRDSKKLLATLREFSTFDFVGFVPNIASLKSNRNNPDTKSVLHGHVGQLKRVQMHSANWQDLCKESNQKTIATSFPSIVQCFQHIRQIYDKSQDLNILVTGSIHLIGATILSLDEMCSEISEQYA